MKTLQAMGFMFYILGIVLLANVTHYSVYSYLINIGCVFGGMILIIIFSDSNHFLKIKYFINKREKK